MTKADKLLYGPEDGKLKVDFHVNFHEKSLFLTIEMPIFTPKTTIYTLKPTF